MQPASSERGQMHRMVTWPIEPLLPHTWDANSPMRQFLDPATHMVA